MRRLVIARKAFRGRQSCSWLDVGNARILSLRAFMASTVLHTCFVAFLWYTPTNHQQEIAQTYSVEILPGVPETQPESEEEEVWEPVDQEAQNTPPPDAESDPVQDGTPSEPIPEAARIEIPPPDEKLESNKAESERQMVQEEPGSGAQPAIASDPSDGESNYWQIVRSSIASKVRYPAFARRQKREGFALVQLTIDTHGELRDLIPLESSAPVFQQCAADAVEKAAPFPPPDHCNSAVLSAVIPIHFRIDNDEGEK
jgi:TonB family protein